MGVILNNVLLTVPHSDLGNYVEPLLQSPCPRNPPHPHATLLFWNAFLMASLRTLGYLETARARTAIWVGHLSMNWDPMWIPNPIYTFGNTLWSSVPWVQLTWCPEELQVLCLWGCPKAPDEQMASTGWHVLFLTYHPKFGYWMVLICWF